MADLDQISAMIGGLQADMRSAKDWFERHEEADQRRFEELSVKIDAAGIRHGDRVTSLEIDRAKVQGGWWVLSLLGAVFGVVGGLLSKWLPWG